MKCYIITLDEIKIKPMLKKLENNGIKPFIFKGVDGKKCSKKTISKYVSKLYANYGPKSAIGCGISHIKLWEDFLKTKEPYLFVCEDDIIFKKEKPRLSQKIQKLLDNTPNDFDILYLGCVGSEKIPSIYTYIMNILQAGNATEEKINNYVKKPRLALATHSYILSRKGAKKLVEHLYGKMYNHIDYCIQNLVYKGIITMYAASPRLIYQTSTDSGNSTNIKTPYPKTVTNLLSSIYLDDYVPLSYVTSVSIAQFGDINVNIISIIFLVAGIICSLLKIDILKLISIFISISILDFFDEKVDIIGFHFALFITPSLMVIG